MNDELEYIISQYLDGTLPPLEASRVEEILATDAQARAIHAEYQRLNQSLRSLPKPQMDWGQLAATISAKTAEEDVPMVSYRIGFHRVLKVTAMAAMILLVVGIGVQFYRQSTRKTPPNETAVAITNPGIQVSGPTIEIGPAPAVAVISIGPAPGFADASIHSSEALLSRPTRVVIASGVQQGQDSGELPY
jgi:negative regulator of sigma E activity